MRRLALAVAASYLAALQTVLASTGTTTSTSTIENQIFYDGFNFPNSTSSWSNDYKANHYNTGHPVWTESRDGSTSTEGILIIEQNSPGWGNADSQDGNTFIAFKRPVVNFSTSISGMTAGFLYDVKFKAMNRNDCNNCGDATLFVYMDDMLMLDKMYTKKKGETNSSTFESETLTYTAISNDPVELKFGNDLEDGTSDTAIYLDAVYVTSSLATAPTSCNNRAYWLQPWAEKACCLPLMFFFNSSVFARVLRKQRKIFKRH